MANQPAVIDAPSDGTVTVEAETIEDALAQISTDLGPNARIISAERVRRGGIGGFFAKEMVEVRVEPVTQPGKGVSAAFDQLLAAAEIGNGPTVEAGTAAAPRMLVGPSTEASGALPSPALGASPGTTAAAIPSALGAGTVTTVDWQPARILEVGLPGLLGEVIGSLDPSDDLAHIQALTVALAPVCGPLPSGAGRLVGERAGRLRSAVDISESHDGYIHLVVGDELPDSLPGVPAVVSWVSDRGAARAISLALGTGARLGYGMASAFGSPARRVSAVDAALAVRDLMERT